MKKILVYYDSMNRKGGVERVIANLFNNLVNIYDITLLTCDEKESAYILDKRIRTISMKRDRTLNMKKSKFYRCCQILLSLHYNHNFLKKMIDNYDYIYVATPLTSLEIFLLGKKAQKKLVVAEHASYYACNSVYKLIRNIVYPNVYCLSVPTKTDTEIYFKKGFPAIFIPHLKSFKAISKKDNFNKTAINIGRFTSDKQQLLLLKIWKNLKDKDNLNGWKLQIIGDGELKNDLLEYIEKNNMNQVAEILNSTPYIEKIYKSSDLFLFTSKLEGFGMVLLEAMSFAIPCISFDCDSGPRDIIENDKNGFLIPVSDEKEFESKVNLIINDLGKLKELSNGALNKVKQWDNSSILEKWYEIFQ